MLPDISMSGLTGDEPASSSRAARRSRDSQPSSVATNGLRLSCDFPNIIHLNVGGHRFTTTLGTLQADPQSMLGRMFSGEHPVLQDEDGSFVIDRDGRHFHHLLNYLRDGSVPIGLSRVERIELLREVDYFSLKTLYQIIGGPTVVAAQMSGGGGGQWLHKLIQDHRTWFMREAAPSRPVGRPRLEHEAVFGTWRGLKRPIFLQAHTATESTPDYGGERSTAATGWSHRRGISPTLTTSCTTHVWLVILSQPSTKWVPLASGPVETLRKCLLRREPTPTSGRS
eukprot:TRINITY_DN8743_c0_g1_i1.p1 TRINITY_DN8743_c0_g1~~TRINITY_DN8743_c0_g1_i1.p1  ORF type:complete len:283 (+),score=13.27 TRINITY_DN8743_c0_g1_i1:132-980(+)